MNDKKIFQGLDDFQPLLEIQNNEKETVIHGIYQINEYILNEHYFANFEVKIIITSKYPKEIPQVYVFGNRLDKCEHRYADDMLCLETEHNLKAFLKKKPTLKEFLIEFFNSFLVGFLHFEKYGEYLFGERKHGDVGIIEMYQERFSTKDKKLAFQLLEIIALKKYRGHNMCPCNSGKRIRNCHGKNSLFII